MIHCPSCSTGSLKIIQPKIENGWTRFYNTQNELIINTGIKSDEVLVYCENCRHWYIMKENKFHHPITKPKKFKIKGYGIYHY